MSTKTFEALTQDRRIVAGIVTQDGRVHDGLIWQTLNRGKDYHTRKNAGDPIRVVHTYADGTRTGVCIINRENLAQYDLSRGDAAPYWSDRVRAAC